MMVATRPVVDYIRKSGRPSSNKNVKIDSVNPAVKWTG